MEGTDEKITRLQVEKVMLLATLRAVEEWAFGEGIDLSPTLKARFAIIGRAIKAEKQIEVTEKQAKAKKGWTPEARAAAGERCRQRMLALHAERRKQRATA